MDASQESAQARGAISREAKSELPHALKVFLLLSAGLTAICLGYTEICRKMNMGLPYSFAYYYVPGDMFADFWSFHMKFAQWGTAEFFKHDVWGYFMYPAPLVHVFRFLLGLPHPRMAFVGMMLAIAAILTAGLAWVLRREGLGVFASVVFAAATALLSYPLIFLVQRCNIEVLIWLVSTVAIWSFFRGRTTTAAVFIGVAAALKFYPFIFLGLLLPRKKYGDFLLGVGTFAAITVVSLYAIGPTIGAAARWDGEQIAAFSKYFVGGLWALGYDHSFFGLVKALTQHWHPNLFAWARPYSVGMAAISVALYFLRMWRLPMANQILALSVLSVTLAPVSYDYTLLNLYPAFAMLAVMAIRAQRRGEAVQHMTVYMVLFAVIFTPESYVIFGGVRYGAQVRAVCLIAMLVMALAWPMGDEGMARGSEDFEGEQGLQAA